MFRLYGHLQVCHVYKNAKIILKLNGSVNLNELQFKSVYIKVYAKICKPNKMSKKMSKN
jgi:hypothetical protein